MLHTFGHNRNDNSILYYLSSISVLLFFMTNGYLLIKKDNITYRYIAKKILDIIKIIILWNIVLMIYKIIVYQNLSNPFKESIKNIFLRGDFFQFWFFGAIIIIYFILPILHKNIFTKEKIYKYFMIVLFFINIIVDIGIITGKLNNIRTYATNELQFVRIWTWLFYFSLGGYYSKYGSRIRISIKKEILILILIIIVQIAYQSFMGKWIYHEVQMSLTYDNIITMLYCYIMFDILMKKSIKENRIILIKELSNNTLGVYIIHLKIVLSLNSINSTNSVFMTSIIFILTIVISNIIVYLVRKVPMVNQLVNL